MSSVLTCVTAKCGRFAVGRCTTCDQPVCGLCSPSDGPVLCLDHRAEAQATAALMERDLARERAASPEARSQRASALAWQQSAEFKELMRASGWKFDAVENATIELLKQALPKLKASAGHKAEPLTITKSLGRTAQLRGWVFGGYTQESGNERDPGPASSLIYVLCEDSTVRVASRVAGRLKLPRYCGALYLDSGAVKGGTVHHDQQGHLLFGNTQQIDWTIRELLGEGSWVDIVLGDLERGPD